MYDLFYSLLQYIWLPGGTPVEETESPKYVSITKYSELKHPIKCNGSYVDTFKSKNYHYYFDQSITKPNRTSK